MWSALGPWGKLPDVAGAVGRDPILKLFVLFLLFMLSALLSSSFIKQEFPILPAHLNHQEKLLEKTHAIRLYASQLIQKFRGRA